MQNKWVGIAVIVVVLGVLYSMMQRAPEGPEDLTILRFGNGDELRELDPATATGVPESHVLDNIFEGLMDLDPETLEPILGTAESFEEIDDTSYRFVIREDARWSDGQPVTAEDFVFSWRRAADPKTASEYAYQMAYLKNGAAIVEGKKPVDTLGVTAEDERTLLIDLERYTPFFLKLLAFTTYFPVPKHVVEKFPGQEWTTVENFVGNGPYTLHDRRLSDYIHLVQNPHYWDKEFLNIKEVFVHPVVDQQTEERMFFAGRLHFTNEVPALKIPSYKEEIEANPGEYHPYSSSPQLATYYFGFNTEKKPFDDARVRKAFALAIDKRSITEDVAQGGQLPAYSFTPPGTGGYAPPQILPTDVDEEQIKEAKELLREAGYPEGKGLPPIELIFNTSENHKRIAVAVQQMLQKNIGASVTLANQEWKVFLNSRREKNYQMTRHGWVGDYDDPMTFLDLFVSNSPNNDTGYTNKEYDRWIARAADEHDALKRLEHFAEAERILMDDLPIIPIYYYTKNKLISPLVKTVTTDGSIVPFTPNRRDRIRVKYMALVKDGTPLTTQ